MRVKKIDNNKNTYLLSYNIEDNKIIYIGSRLSHGPDLIFSNNEHVYICDYDHSEYNISNDYPTKLSYEITYLGNNNYSDPIIKTIETFKEAINRSCID